MASWRLGLFTAASALGLAWPTISAAQVTDAENLIDDSAERDGGAIVVLGARGQPRTVLESPVPIDVIPQAEIESVSSTDTLDVLKTLVPSYSVGRNANSDGNTFVRSATLRGLAGDKTLLLVNSKRRHKSAVMTTGGSGAQAADAAVIPSLALKTVEVLRDGAAAQYGSDAIAGVINFVLKDDAAGITLTAQGGQYYEGDGTEFIVAGNIGLPLGDRGFVNLTAEYTKADRTVRARQYCNPGVFCVDEYAAAHPEYAALIDLDKPVERVGQPKSEAIRTFVNSGFELSDAAELYAFGNYSRSQATNDFFYRYPGNAQPVNDNPVRLEDGTVFRFAELFPAGFTPQFTGKVTDYSVVGGLRGIIGSEGGLQYDLSARYGRSKIAYGLENTVNASLGPDSPTEFKPGTLISDELSFNADLTYAIASSLFAEPLTLSMGGEFRREGYEVIAGDPDSYRPGIFAFADPFDFCTDEHTLRPDAPQDAGINCGNYQSGTADGFAGIDPAFTLLAVGSNGFPGLAPNAAGTFSRDSFAFYGESSTDVLEGLFVDLAARYEHFADFGSTFNVKAATKVDIADFLSLRASVGTGFRAPTAGQLSYTSVSVQNVDGMIQQTGLFPATNSVSQYLGAKPLQPEKSFNASAGLVLTPFPGASLTVDGYLIKISDQLYSTSSIAVTPAIRDQMVLAGVAGADSISSVRFFQNAFDSTTKGVDVVGTYRHQWGAAGTTNFTATLNVNRYKITHVLIPNLLNDTTVFNFERSAPRWRSNISVSHGIGGLSAMVRANLYGPYTVQLNRAPAYPRQQFAIEPLIDAEITYAINDMVTIAVGGRNIFDNYPAPDKIGATVNTQIYRTDSPVDWQGGFYYGRIRLSF